MLTYLSLGSNLSNKEDNLHRALVLLSERVGTQIKCSSIFHSEPWGFSSAHQFANMVAIFDTTLDPLNLLSVTQQIEIEMGRTQKSINGEYHDRIIDIDILLYEGVNMNTKELTIPHPLMTQREFVMQPLREIEPECELLIGAQKK